MTSEVLSGLGAIHPAALTGSRLQVHYAIQWLSRAARSFIDPVADDSHTNLFWIPEIRSFASQKLPTGWTFGLRLPELELFVLDAQGSRDTLHLDGMTEDDASHWVYKRIEKMGYDPYSMEYALPYKMPDHSVAREGTYEAIDESFALNELARWFTSASRILSQVSEIYKRVSPGISPIRCWPHHFDLAIRIRLDKGYSNGGRSIGVGLSPGDEYYKEPYFYVNPWPPLDVARLRPLEALGHWHTNGFIAAVAPASRIISSDHQEAELLSFLRNAIDFGRIGLAA